MAKKRKTPFFKYYFSKEKNVFKWFFNVLKSLFRKGDILKANGSHIITAYPGGGKTLLMNKIINELDTSKYFVLSNMKEFDGAKSFDLNEIFKDGRQVRSFPTTDEKGRKLWAVIFDEINLNFNKRENKKTSYNNVFVGLVEFLVSHRHQDVPRVYFIGQKLELQDTQLISLFQYHHDIIKKYKWPFYWLYYKNNYVEFAPKKLKVIHKMKDTNDELQAVSCNKYKIKREDLETYNTKYLGETYKKLDNIKIV